MDYIREINAFYEKAREDKLSTNCFALWHALMQINNRTFWKPTFTVSISELMEITGMSKRTVERTRITLQEMGYIQFTSRSGKLSAVYSMVSLVRHTDAQTENLARHTDAQTQSSASHRRTKEVLVRHTDAINKQDLKTTTNKQKISREKVNPIDNTNGYADFWAVMGK